MYITPFWCGFICGSVVAIGAFVTLLIHTANKQKIEKEEQ